MRKTKKMLMMIPILGLFLSGCTFQEGFEKAKSWVQNIFNGGKKEEKTSDDPTPSGDPTPSPSGDPTPSPTPTPEVNPLWPAEDIKDVLDYNEITDTFPGYTGEAESISLEYDEESGYYVEIKLNSSTTEASALSTYASDLTRAQYTKGEIIQTFQSYVSPNNQLLILPYTGTGYLYLAFGAPSSGGGGDTNSAAIEIVNNVFAPYNLEMEYDSEYGYYLLVANVGEDGVKYTDTKAGESVLKPAADEIISMLPSTLGTHGAGKFYSSSDDFWGDNSGDTAYEYVYDNIPNDDGTLKVFSYVYNNNLLVQIAYYEAQ